MNKLLNVKGHQDDPPPKPSPAWQAQTMAKVRQCGPHNITPMQTALIWKVASCAVACSIAFYVYIAGTDNTAITSYIQNIQQACTFQHLLQLSL